jgi:translocation and assembly module TamB
MEIREGALYYRSASGAERTVDLGDTRATLVSDADRHRLELRVTDADALRLDAEVEAARVAGRPLGELPLRGTVKGASRQLGLLPLVVDAIDDAGGNVDLDFTIAGRLRAPRLAGHARLEDGKLDFYQANLRLRDLRADLSLDDTSLAIEAEGKAGEGTMQVDGKLGWRSRQLHGEMTLRGENLLLADVPEARVNASPDLRFVIGDGRASVTGRVVVPSARIAPADTAGAVLASADEQVVSPDDMEGPGKLLVTTDVSVTLEDKVAVRAYGLRGNVKGTVRMQSAPREGTVASGELEVVDGVYKAYGRELEVERGRLLFTGGPVSDPGVDLRATRDLPGYEVGVIARGPLRRPQLTLFSEPSLPQYQIASMLIVGRTSIQGDGEGEFDSSDVTEGGGAFLAGQLGKYVGLDEVGVTQDADTGTELVIGKYLTPRLFVSYGISLVEEINTLKLRYTLDDRWTLSAESGIESAADVEYRIEDK